MAIPLLDECDISGKDITTDALLTQRKLAEYIFGRNAHYHFIVKDNQPRLEKDICLIFEQPGEPDYCEPQSINHGRIEKRSIWCSTAINDYLDFPHVGQVFMIKRERTIKKTGEFSAEIAFGVTSRTPKQCDREKLVKINHGH